VLLTVIIDDREARAVALVMLAALAAWIAIAWTAWYPPRCQAVNVAAESVVTSCSVVLILALPAGSALIVAIAFVTLNFMWAFVFLRPRIVYAAPFGIAYLVAVTVAGAVLWDRYGKGAALPGLNGAFAGVAGGAVVVFAYTAFLLALSAFVAYRLERGERVDFLLRREIEEAHQRSERLLTNILPVPVAERLKANENPIADNCAAVSVVFADIVGFTTMSTTMEPAALLELLNTVFTRFDELAVTYGLEKIKTIGDAYMAAAGVPEGVADHALAAVDMATAMLRSVSDLVAHDGTPLRLRVGVATGPAIAGVIGTRKFSYDLWGDTVNTASRMESHGVPGCVHVDAATKELVGHAYSFRSRGLVTVRGKGEMETFLVEIDVGHEPAT
jgi:class 3 adenylate cyclase